MKIRGWMAIVGLCLFVFGITACGGGGKYSDVKSTMKKLNTTTEKWMETMEKADTAKKVAAALTDFTNKMKDFRTEMTKMEEKYPELKDMSDPPEELKEEAAKMEDLWSKMFSAMAKTSQFADDPDVQKAQEDFQEVLK